VEELYRGDANTVGKQYFTFLYSQARCAAFTSRNIKSALAKAKIMSYEDIQEAQRKRDEKEATGTGRRGRKRKNSTPVPWRGKKSRAKEIAKAYLEI
jgi:hypothetical protein